MISVNALGDACPLPVVKTIDAIKSLNGAAGTVEVLVDNDTAVQNLKRLAGSKGYAIAVAAGREALPRRAHRGRSG